MFVEKCVAIPELHCALTLLGPLALYATIVTRIRESFTSFDEMRAGIEPFIREIFEANCDASHSAEVMVIGWSKQTSSPDAFRILLHEPEEIKKRHGPNVPPPFEIASIDMMLFNPCPSEAELQESRLPFSPRRMPDVEFEQLNPAVDLLHLMEVQRRQTFSGVHTVGGYALLTGIDRHGVTQRRIQGWPEDKVGELIKPLPINWANWRVEREALHDRRERREINLTNQMVGEVTLRCTSTPSPPGVPKTFDHVFTGSITGTSSGTISMTTALTNDIIVLLVHCENTGSTQTVSSVTSSGLTWALRKRISFNNTNDSLQQNMEVWWAYSSAALTSSVITVTLSGTTDRAALMAFGVNGCNSFAAPFDTNASLPASATNPTASVVTPQATISTDGSNPFVFGFYGGTVFVPNLGSGYSPIAVFTNHNSNARAEFQNFTSVQSFASAGFTTALGVGGTDWGVIVDVLL